jgi:hypothetical protein
LILFLLGLAHAEQPRCRHVPRDCVDKTIGTTCESIGVPPLFVGWDGTSDGVTDLLVTMPGSLDLFVGPDLSEQITVSVGVPRELRTADFDGDGLLDLIEVLQDGRTLALHPGDGTAVAVVVADGPWAPEEVAWVDADLDGDGDLDLVLLHPNDSGAWTASVHWHTSAWTFRDDGIVAPIVDSLPLGVHADINGDGLHELLLGAWGAEVAVWRLQDLGTLVEGAPLPLTQSDALVVLDLDGDGADEVVGVGEVWAAGTVTPFTAPLRARPWDVDDDGDLDLVGYRAETVEWTENVAGQLGPVQLLADDLLVIRTLVDLGNPLPAAVRVVDGVPLIHPLDASEPLDLAAALCTAEVRAICDSGLICDSGIEPREPWVVTGPVCVCGASLGPAGWVWLLAVGFVRRRRVG